MKDRILNTSQQKAVKYGNGPLLIIAGAGTGKTTVITERIKYLIQKKKVAPENILALTFTEKAAAEMEERVDKIMPYGYTQMWISTFHSFCDQILREEALQIGLTPGYKLMSEAENVLLLKKNIFKLKLDYFRPLGNPTKFVEALLTHFARLKDEDITPDQYMEYSKILTETAKNPEDKEDALKTRELAESYKLFERLKMREGVMDFSDLIANTLLLFRTRKKILSRFQKQFQYVLVDEFQDTNYAQNELAILLAGDNKNITVVADDDQAIYRWRGAAISNVMQFKKNFVNAEIVTLTQNYRSTQEILDHAYSLIQNNNPNRLEVMENINKKLISSKKSKTSHLDLILTDRVDEEAEGIAKKILELTKKKYKYQDIAILVRANNHAHSITTALSRLNIPYQFLGPGQLFQQEEIKDLIAYMKVLYDLSDSISLFRVLQMDIYNIPARELNFLLNFAKKNNLSLFETLDELDQTFLSLKTREELKSIREMILRHLNRVKKDTAGQLLYYFLVDSGIYLKLAEINSVKEEKISLNIAKFFDRIKGFEIGNQNADIYAVVDWIDLMMILGDSPLAVAEDWRNANAVNILTVHSSKGLEFPIVFLINLVSDRFPSRERREKIPIPEELIKEMVPEGNYHLQEERRLFYVGMTRAKDQLFFTASKFYGEGKREKKLSPFILEAAPDIIAKKQEKDKVKQLSLSTIMDSFAQVKETIHQDKRPKINFVSYSQLQTFDICPLHYKARFLLGLPTNPSGALSFGISMHSAMQHFYEAVKNKQKVTKETFFELLDKSWRRQGFVNREHENEMKKNGKKLLSSYFETIYNPKHIPAALELPFSFYLKNGLRVGGKIDRVDVLPNNQIEIIDYKTGQTQKNGKKSYNFQLGMYALAANKVKHELFDRRSNDIIVSLLYLETGEKITETISKNKLDEIEDQIIKKVTEIEKSDFNCSKNLLCANCEYKMLCNIN